MNNISPERIKWIDVTDILKSIPIPEASTFTGVLPFWPHLKETPISKTSVVIPRRDIIVFALPELNKMFSGMPVDPKIKQELINIMGNIAKEIKTHGFSLFYTISILFNNLFVNIIFGFIGGVISMQILNKRKDIS